MADATSRPAPEGGEAGPEFDIRSRIADAMKRGDIMLALAVVGILVVLMHCGVDLILMQIQITFFIEDVLR